MKLRPVTKQDVFLHVMVFSFLFVFMGSLATILGSEIFGDGYKFNKENTKTFVALGVFFILFMTDIHRRFVDFRPWIYVYFIILLVLRMFFW